MSQSHTPEGPRAGPSRPKEAARDSGWTGGRIAALVIGGLLALLSLGLLGGGGVAVWALFQRDSGYVTTDVHQFSTPGSALATERVELGSSGAGWLYAPTVLDKVRIRVTPASPGPPLFVGIGPSTDVDRYLAGVNHTVITDYWGNSVEAVGGGKPRSAPGAQDFWVASSSGPGARALVWDPADGSWAVVVMNADGRPGINVGADLGARIPALPWITVGLLLVGAISLAGGALLIAGAIRRRRAGGVSTV